MKNHIKLFMTTIIGGVCLFLGFSAQADFRKALDAYIARDGDTMLKEVKHAVDTKNDDGLMLFLMATNMDEATSDYDAKTKQSKSTLRAILPGEKWDEIRGLLVKASIDVDTQYYLDVKSQFKDNSIIYKENQYKNSKLAMFESTSLKTRAKAGDAFSRLQLGLKYFNFNGDYGCDISSKEPLCKVKNVDEGYLWLKKAAKSYEFSGYDDLGVYANAMCNFFQNDKNSSEEHLKQTYLWCLLGVNTRGGSFLNLEKMYKAGQLKKVAPELSEVWNDRNSRSKLLYPIELAS